MARPERPAHLIGVGGGQGMGGVLAPLGQVERRIEGRSLRRQQAKELGIVAPHLGLPPLAVREQEVDVVGRKLVEHANRPVGLDHRVLASREREAAIVAHET